MTTISELATSELVYWCEKDQWFVSLEHGKECPSNDCYNEGSPYGQWATLMRKRRGWVCTEFECGSIIFGTKTYAMSYYKENHVHHEFN